MWRFVTDRSLGGTRHAICLQVSLCVSMSIGLVTIAKQSLGSSNRTRFLFAPAVWRKREASSTNMATKRHRKSKALQNKLDVDRHRKQERTVARRWRDEHRESREYWQERIAKRVKKKLWAGGERGNVGLNGEAVNSNEMRKSRVFGYFLFGYYTFYKNCV